MAIWTQLMNDCEEYDEYDREEGEESDREEYDDEEHVRKYLRRRVFVDYEVFMKYVLHVPEDWETKWRPALDAVKADANFKKYYENYCGLCGGNGALEQKNSYPPLVETANAVLDVVSRSNFNNILSETRRCYRVGGGVMDIDENHPRPGPDADKSLHRANPLHVLEVKPYDNVICDGKNMPRLVVNGKCPAGPFSVGLSLT